uniref:Tc1-like transposase DDE domain-containing protein n=1 Tax=Oryzias latipes TaxID=8090 RepID=A0A3B3I8E1_ORYLA
PYGSLHHVNNSTSTPPTFLPHMVWPAMSPNLNPVEHVWAQLKQRMDDYTPPLSNMVELVETNWVNQLCTSECVAYVFVCFKFG